MQKTLLNSRTQLIDGLIVKEIYVTKKVLKKHRECTPTTKLFVGWNAEGGCAGGCAQPTATYYEQCISDECVRFYF